MKKNKFILPFLALLFVSAILLGIHSAPKTTLNENTDIQTSSNNLVYICDPTYFALANEFKTLLEANSFTVTLINMTDVASTSFSSYSVIIIGPHTDLGYTWGTVAQCAAVDNSGKSVLGLHRGGLAYFANISLYLSNGNSMGGTGTELNVTYPSHRIFQIPYPLTTDDHMQICSSAVSMRGILDAMSAPDVVCFGQLEGYPEYTTLAIEKNKYIYWGFPDGPSSWTMNGTQLFVNVVAYLVSLSPPGGIPGFEIVFALFSLVAIVIVVGKKRILPFN